MAEEGEVPLKVEEKEEGEKQQTQEEDAERTRESSPSSTSDSDQDEVDAGKEKEEEGGEQPKPEPASEGGEQQAESQESAESKEAVTQEPVAAEPEKPAETEQQVEPEKPAETEQQVEPEKPAETEQQVEPEKPAETEQQVEPEKPAETEQQVEPEKPAETEQQVEPEKPAEPQQPVGQETAAGPTEDEKPAEPEKQIEEQPPPAEGSRATVQTVTVSLTLGEDELRSKEGTEEREESPTPGVPIQYGEFLRLMQIGTDLTKVKKKSYARIFRLEDDLLGITWNSRSKRSTKARITVQQIKEVRSGRSTDSFKLHGNTYPEERCFSLIYVERGKFKTLDLVALSPVDAHAWVQGLKTLVREEDSEYQRSKVRERWLRDLFEEADKNGDGTLDLKEVLRMMQRLNIGISKKILKAKFKEADSDGNFDGKLNFEEFCSLFKELATRPELRRLFNLYSSKKEWLTTEDLQRFLEAEQGVEDPSLEYCTQLINRYEPTDEGKAQGMMSNDGFAQFMVGPEMDIFRQSHGSVYQDMTQPLSHYFIASSHNTYLLEDQLKGPSSVEAYIRALRKGCRCVELDCWDGEGGEPVVYHGHTLTSKILFKDAIEAIKEHAFATSPYPVILSIENHCSIPQQHVLAQHMKDILGEQLYTEEVDESRTALPSPEALKHKILVKGKKLKKELEDLDDDEGEVSDEDEAAEIDSEELKKAGVEPTTPGTAKPDEPPPPETPKEGAQEKPEVVVTPSEEGAKETAEGATAAAKTEEQKTEEEKKPEEGGEQKEGATGGDEKKPEEGEKEASGQKLEPTPSKKSTRRRTLSFSRKQRRTAPAVAGKKVKLSAQLSKCINYVQSIHFKGFENLDDGKINQMSSFGESSAVKYSVQTASRFMLYNKRQLSRIYPAGSRVNSSNYDPVNVWNCGCQIVALNYQTAGKSMDLNDGKFLQNGGCGYVLKPDIMREEISRFDHTSKHAVPGVVPKLFTIKVISGQHLPKPEGGSKTGEIIDPYVVIQTVGVPEDRHQMKTKPVNDNGFNPVWNETFQFVIKFPELALMRFKVMDRDWGPNQDDFIGQFALPFESIEPGYRHIHLTASGNVIENATIFVHVETREFVAAGPARGHGQKKKPKVKKSREYPEPHVVGLQVIDERFRTTPVHIHRAVDLREDYAFALANFKESCGRGPQALLGDCVVMLAARAKGSGLSLYLDVIGENQEQQVYRVGVGKEAVSVPPTLQTMMEAFNQLNTAIQALLKDAEEVANNLAGVYAECKEHQGDLREHLRQISAPLKKEDQVMEHYCMTMCTLQAEASTLRKLKEQAANDLKKLFAASQKYEIELKTSL